MHRIGGNDGPREVYGVDIGTWIPVSTCVYHLEEGV